MLGVNYALFSLGVCCMAILNTQDINSVLSEFTDPWHGQDLVSAKQVEAVEITDKKVSVELKLGYPAVQAGKELANDVESALQARFPENSFVVSATTEIISHSVQKNLTPLPEVKNIIAVASGKGGVGKSTTSVNLALALAAEGATVGVLDADIYGPSIPRMMGASGKPESEDGKSVEPMVSHGIQFISIGLLIDEETPMVWRGPMVTQALEQLLRHTHWQGLDYLIIDLPPGTGDIQLTLAQKIPVSGAVIVTTPQDISLLDALKGLKMFEKVEVPVLGVIENMSTHICSSCGHEEHIFGAGGGARMAEDNEVEFLGSLPLDISIREQADSGAPTVIHEPAGKIANMYKEIAIKTAAKLAIEAQDFSHHFPNIVIKND